MASLLVFRRWICATVLLGALLCAPMHGRAEDFPPQIPECHGRDLLVDLKARNPDAYDRWVEAARKTPNSNAILWRIEGNGLAESSWLFGTMHSTDPRILNIPVEAQQAFIQSRALAVESTDYGSRWIDYFNTLFALPVIYLPDEKTWDHYLTGAEMKFMETELQAYGYTLDNVKRLQPWAAMVSMLPYPNCELWRIYYGLRYLDEELEHWARQAGKPVIGLETRYESTRTIAETPLEAQFRAMLTVAKTSEAPEDEYETSIQIYLNRQIGLFFEYEHGPYELSSLEIQAAREFMRHAADLRNLTMRDRSLPLIAQGGAFIAVGTAHLPGENGLVELFRKAGYEVTPVN